MLVFAPHRHCAVLHTPQRSLRSFGELKLCGILCIEATLSAAGLFHIVKESLREVAIRG